MRSCTETSVVWLIAGVCRTIGPISPASSAQCVEPLFHVFAIAHRGSPIFLLCVADPGVRFAALRLAPPFCHDARVPPTVLIVDDHPSFRASARAILEADGFEIVGEAEDGTTGLRMLRSLRPDIVLLDV